MLIRMGPSEWVYVRGEGGRFVLQQSFSPPFLIMSQGAHWQNQRYVPSWAAKPWPHESQKPTTEMMLELG